MSTGDFEKTVRTVAHLLGGGWHYRPYESGVQIRAELAGNAGRCIYLRVEKGRVCVSGHYPYYADGRYGSPLRWSVLAYGESTPYITVALSRGALAIAREIKRRFLSEYLELFDRCMKKKAELRKADDRLRAIEGCLVRVNRFGKALSENKHTSVRGLRLRYKLYSGSGEIKLSADGTEANIDINWVPIDLAIRISALIEEFEEEVRQRKEEAKR